MSNRELDFIIVSKTLNFLQEKCDFHIWENRVFFGSSVDYDGVAKGLRRCRRRRRGVTYARQAGRGRRFENKVARRVSRQKYVLYNKWTLRTRRIRPLPGTAHARKVRMLRENPAIVGGHFSSTVICCIFFFFPPSLHSTTKYRPRSVLLPKYIYTYFSPRPSPRRTPILCISYFQRSSAVLR